MHHKPPTHFQKNVAGGGLRYPSGATSRKFNEAVEQYLVKVDNFVKEEKQLFNCEDAIARSSTQRVAAADKSNS
jgi:hypothetical protein